ncbi:TIGR00730 family Rossman fold protein [Aerococcaceae bacterium WGS1372]
MKITVYCGSNHGNAPQFVEAAHQLGQWIGQKSYDLVYGGGTNGLMGVVADAVLEEDGQVYGVIPEVLCGIENKHPLVQNMEIVGTMSERKNRMIELGDVFIALPGGVGTLEEIAEIISLIRIGIIDKPAIFYNINSFYNPLHQQFQTMVNEGFLKQEVANKFLFSNSLQDIDQFIHDFNR